MTDLTWLRVLERMHGHLGWLTVLALLHPAVLLRRPGRRAGLAASLSTGLVTLTCVLGATIYPSCRRLLKQALYQTTPAIGWWFERKEHLAVGVLTFAWVGLLAHLAAPGFAPEQRPRVAALAWRAYVLAAGLAAVVATVGTIVSVTTTF